MNAVSSSIARFVRARVMLSGLVVAIAVLMFTIPDFMSLGNLNNLLVQVADLVIVACGMTFVVLNGGIDFSVTSIIAFGSVCGSLVMSGDRGILAGSPWATPVAILVILAVGLAIGVVNGLSVILLKMPSFIVTLATQTFFSGLAVVAAGATTIYYLPDSFNRIGSGTVLGLPLTLWLAVATIVVTHFLLSRTAFGQKVYLVGTNPHTAYISGINTKRVIFMLFIISGLAAAVACIVMTSRLQAGSPGLANNMFIDIIACIIIGGNNIAGGEGRIGNTVIGAIFITVLGNSLNLLGVTWFLIMIIKGVLIVGSVLLCSKLSANSLANG